MNEKDTVRTSKFLSLVLRHKPELIGLELDPNGWASVPELVHKCTLSGNTMTFEMLEHVVETNPKKRFAFNDDQTLIRASQGHSVAIDLGLLPRTPPEILYHGTAYSSLDAILENGLKKQSRQHVHLSADKETAVKVGSRHGKPVVLEVAALGMSREGFEFFLSENEVWLVDAVPREFLNIRPTPL